MNRPRSTDRSLFRFCPFCGSRLDGRTCPACGYVQYRSPICGVAAVILERDLPPDLPRDLIEGSGPFPADAADRPLRVLLGRRRPGVSRGGLWCIPCGYVEYDEEIREALRRETLEETGLIVEPGDVIAVHSNFHDPDSQTIGIWFRVRAIGGTLRPGDDLDALAFASPANADLPLAFPTDELVLSEMLEIGYPL